MELTIKDKILFGLITLLLLSVGYLLYVNFNIEKSIVSKNSSIVNAPTPGDTVTPIAIGSNASAVLGTVTAIKGSVLSIKTNQGKVMEGQITSNAKVTIVGAAKSLQVYQLELDAYNAKVTELLKDPEKNRVELENLSLPISSVETPSSVADIKLGDSLAVTFDGGGNIVRIVRTSASQTEGVDPADM